jgi:hypothetical protein
MRKTLVSVVSLLALVSASALADIRKEEDAKIQYDVPAGWKVETEGNMVALGEDKKNDADREIVFYISKFEKAQSQKATSEMDQILSSVVKDMKPAGEPEKAKHNGMDAVRVKATGTYEGKPVNVSMMILSPPGNMGVIVAGVVLQAKKDAWGATVQKFISSIKPL